VLDVVLADSRARIDDIIVPGYMGVSCVETGGPKPGDGCAGRGVVTALRALRDQGIMSPERYDMVIFDILGDVVCGGFSLPLKEGFADMVYIVTTCDFMAMYAANNICTCVEKFAQRNAVKLGGIIYNERSVVHNVAIPNMFAERLGSKVIGTVPQEPLIMRAELSCMTLMQYAPECEAARCFYEMAEYIRDESTGTVPRPMTADELDDFFASMKDYYGDLPRLRSAVLPGAESLSGRAV
jgi:nitrogenase iron protein NifH